MAESEQKASPDMRELFKLAPAEQRSYLDGKALKPSFDYRDFAAREHAFAFTVAKSAGYDILDDLHESLKRANAEHIPYKEWAAQIEPILRQKGWWGKKPMADPRTGETKLVQLGSARRLRTIYWANMMTAFAAAEWQRSVRNKAFLPILLYEPSKALHPRLSHERFYGFMAPVDDPVWRWLYPPNAWRCQCWARQISRREAQAHGYEPGQTMPEWLRPVMNKRTGETEYVPEGIDPSWKNNPGMFRAENIADFLSDEVEAMPPERRQAAIEDIAASPLLPAMLHMRKEDRYFIPVAPVPERAVKAFAGTSAAAPAAEAMKQPAYAPGSPLAHVADLAKAEAEKQAGQSNKLESGIARLSSSSLIHILAEHKERGLNITDLRAAISIIAKPAAIIRRRSGNDNKNNAAVFIGESGNSWWRVAVKYVASAKEWWLASFHKKTEKEAKSVIRAAEKKGEVIK